MQAFKQISRFLSICLLAFIVIVQPAAASGLASDPFIRQNLDRRNFEPGGKYHLFGSRGATAERTGEIHIIPTGEQTFIHNKMEIALISGDIGYTTRFNGHGHHVHAPFDNHASRSDKSSNGQFAIDRTTYSLRWTGHEHHPADGYDGPQGSGYPAPTGARDEYSYKIEGLASRISVIQPDSTTSSRNRIENRFTDAGKAFTERIPSAWEKATTHNPTKSGVGNAGEAFNATFSGINNVLGAGLGILGAGDIAEFGLTALAVGNVENAGAMDEDSQIAFVEKMIDNANKIDHLKSAYGSWKATYPNAAEVAEAAVNIAGSVTGMKAVTAMKGAGHVRTRYDFTGIEANPIKRAQMGAIALPKRKAAVSENFADAQQGRYGYNTPYHSRNIRTELEQRYGKGNITSSTVPPSNGKNVKLANKSHPITGVPFDSKGFPNFEKYAKYDTRINTKEFRSKSSTGQMKLATKDLAEAIKRGEINSSSFTTEQLKAIEKGKAKIPEYTWHHHQDTGRMQLTPESKHMQTGHIGGEAMDKGK